jgi:hypothetical protein
MAGSFWRWVSLLGFRVGFRVERSSSVIDYKTYLIVRIEEDEGDHHEIVWRPADEKSQDDDDGDAQRFEFGAPQEVLPPSQVTLNRLRWLILLLIQLLPGQ